MLNVSGGSFRVRPHDAVAPGEVRIWPSDGPGESVPLPEHLVGGDAIEAINHAVNRFVGRRGRTPERVDVSLRLFVRLAEDSKRMSKWMSEAQATRFPRELHAPTGRPGLFGVQRDWAIDRGDQAAIAETERAAELWHRAPEEWELERVDLGAPWTLIDVGSVFQGDWVFIDNQQINAEAIRRLVRSAPQDLQRFFRELGLEARPVYGRNAVEVRPMALRVRLRTFEYPRGGRPPHVIAGLLATEVEHA